MLLPSLTLLLLPCCALAAGLVDNPIGADSITYLHSGWTASTPGTSSSDHALLPGSPLRIGPTTIPASVPGDLLTDLQRAGLIGDPLAELNFLNESAAWTANTWTYRTSFSVSAADAGGASGAAAAAGGDDDDDAYLLVFDGVKMGAEVRVNGVLLGTAVDQFLRYSFALNSSVLGLGRRRRGGGGGGGGGTTTQQQHELELTFDPGIACGGRWMACTGGWDWAPYSSSAQAGAPTFSYGVWKSVYVARVAGGTGAAIAHVVPQIFYAGSEYPTAPLADGAHGGFAVDVRVHLTVPPGGSGGGAPVTGTLTVQGDWGGSASKQVTLAPGDSTVTLSMTASAAQVLLWWPVGAGSQPLYNITVGFTPAAAAADATAAAARSPPAAPAIRAVRRVGFRVFALVTGNDTDPAYVAAAASQEGTASLGMVWRINGAAIMPRGANMIPMEELEGRLSGAAHRRLVQSAVDGGMNTLRVWGGGMFLPDAWYDAVRRY